MIKCKFIAAWLIAVQVCSGVEAPISLDDAFAGELLVTREPSDNGESVSYSVKIFNTKANQFSLSGEIGSVLLYVIDTDGHQVAFAPLAFHPRASSKEHDREFLSFEFTAIP